MNQVQIQLQDVTGNWRTFNVTVSNSQIILSEMKKYLIAMCLVLLLLLLPFSANLIAL